MSKRLAILMSGTVAAGLVAWGGMAIARGDSSPPATTPAAPKKSTGVQVQGSKFGDVLFDGKGFVLYLFTKDKPGKSRCYGGCAKAWPPLLKKGKLTAGSGVDAADLGTTERRDKSKQVTYKHRPLYYYEHDDEPGEILCHDVTEFGGDWFVVQPDGEPAP